MAKFKVGDRVRFIAGPIKGEYGKIISLGKKNGCYDVQSAYGEILTNTPEGELARNSTSSTNPVVQNALKACNAEQIPEGWKRAANPGAFKKGDTILLYGKIYKIVDDFKYSDEVTVQPIQGGRAELRDILHAVRIVKNSAVAANAGVRVGLQKLLHSLSKAKTDIGASLGKFNEEDWGDELAWAQKVNRACDDVARAINNAVRVLGS